MGEQDYGQQEEQNSEQTSHSDQPLDFLNMTRDAWLKAEYGISLLDVEQERNKNPIDYNVLYRHHSDESVVKAVEVMGFQNDFVPDLSAWNDLPKASRPDFLEWRLTQNLEFKKRWDSFLAEISPVAPSQTAIRELNRYYEERREAHVGATEVEEITTKIEDMSEQEIREEIIRRVNNALGKLLMGPLVDGSGPLGFRRIGEASLMCSYLRFIKVMDEEENLRGVQIELLGLKNARRDEFIQFEESLEESDSRYYFAPVHDELPTWVTTESFYDRAKRVNPEVAGQVEDFVKGYTPGFLEFFRYGAPGKVREGTTQDVRDALAVVRAMDRSVRDVIYRTPPHLWGRSGLTE